MPSRSTPVIKGLKTVIKQLPLINTWYGKHTLSERYDEIMAGVYEPRLRSDPGRFHIGEIEINRNCNLDCIMCKSSMSTRPQINMPLDLFERTVKLVKEHGGRRTTLHTIGEPLLNNVLPDYLGVLRTHGVRIMLSTNAILLRRKLDLLVEFSDVIVEIRLSVDGATKATYELIRERGKFDKLLENLDYFKEKTSEKQPFRKVRVSSVVSTDTLPELGYHMLFYSKYVPMEDIDLNLVSGLSPDNSYFLNASILKNHIVPWPPCDQLFSSTIHVLNDGRVSACCRDYNADLVHASLEKGTIPVDDLINNERITELRKQPLEGRIPENSLCASCYRVDPKVSALFSSFVAALVTRYSSNWKADEMQDRFEQFFQAFSTGFPSRARFASLIE